ncbi:MAG TPA: DUF6438 domain-containing protein [Flavobacteriaceae bacterium]|jgi:hypothetical protein
MTLLTTYFTKKQKQSYNIKDAFISLSKGRCLNSCPVYDLWIFKDGQVVYNGIENVEKQGIHKMLISHEAIKHLHHLLLELAPEDIGNIRERKKPLTLLKFKGKRIVYQSTRVSGNLLELDRLFESIIKSL